MRSCCCWRRGRSALGVTTLVGCAIVNAIRYLMLGWFDITDGSYILFRMFVYTWLENDRIRRATRMMEWQVVFNIRDSQGLDPSSSEETTLFMRR